MVAMVGNREARRRLSRCVSDLLASQHFFGHMVLTMPLVEDDSVEGVACDGSKIYYNPDWVVENSTDLIKVCAARVSVACALKHHTRRGERDYGLWQHASQLATQPLMEDAGFAVPHGQGMDMPIEKIYDLLKKEQGEESSNKPKPQAGAGQGGGGGSGGNSGQDGDGQGQGSAQDAQGGAGGDSGAGGGQGKGRDPLGTGEIMDAPQEAREEQEQEWDERGQQALQSTKAEGRNAGKAATMLEARNGREDWRTLLRDFMTSAAKADYTMAQPNRRYIDQGLYLPALRSEACAPIVIAIDTSGSLSADELAIFWGEIREIASEVKPENIRLIQCDARIAADDEYDPMDMPDEIVAKGRGGTAFTPVFDKLEDADSPPACLIYFTDGYCTDFPDIDPGYPVLWMLNVEAGEDSPWKEGRDGHWAAPDFGQVLTL